MVHESAFSSHVAAFEAVLVQRRPAGIGLTSIYQCATQSDSPLPGLGRKHARMVVGFK
jgi:hypothetical protein